MSESDFEELSQWQDVLDDVVNGRDDGLICPFCEKTSISVDDEGGVLRVSCSECGRWVEGQNAF